MKLKRYISLILAAALSAALLAGCGASSKSSGAPAALQSEAYYADTSDALSDAPDLKTAFSAPAGRKIIYTTHMNIETKDFPRSAEALLSAAAQAGGYLQSSEEWGSAEQGNRRATYVFRIPAEKYQGFLSEADSSGSVTNRQESTQDITAEYVDTEAHISALQAQKERLEVLRDKAETLEDLLTIESHLSSVQYELDSWTGQMRLYDDQVDYCTVETHLREVAIYTPANTFGNRIAAAFEDAGAGFVSFLQDALIALIYALPYLVLLLLLVLVLRFVLRRLPKNRKPFLKKKTPPPADQP